MNQMRERMQLRDSEEFGSFLMIIADIVERLGNALGMRSSFGFCNDDRNAFIKNVMSVRISGGVPLLNVNSSVT
jgi:hypothetical protein